MVTSEEGFKQQFQSRDQTVGSRRRGCAIALNWTWT
jgi:hypothetical protein